MEEIYEISANRDRGGVCYPENDTVGIQILDDRLEVFADDGEYNVTFRTNEPGIYWAYAFGKRPDGTIVYDDKQMLSIDKWIFDDRRCEGSVLDRCPVYTPFVPNHVRRIQGDLFPTGEAGLQPGTLRIHDAKGTLVYETMNRSIYGGYYFGFTDEEIKANNWSVGGNWTVEYIPVVPTTTGVEFTWITLMPRSWQEGIPCPPGQSDWPCAG